MASESAGEKSNLIRFSVDADDSGTRLDLFLAKQFPELSRSMAQKLIRSGQVSVNLGPCKPGMLLSACDLIEMRASPIVRESRLQPVAIPLDIVFEDEDIIVINKRAGIAVHPGAGPPEPTLVQGLLHHCQTLGGGGDDLRPGIVHRLDKDTTGILVAAKTNAAHTHLSEQFRSRTASRRYEALLDGGLRQEAIECRSYLRRDPNNRLRFVSLSERDFEELARSDTAKNKAYRFAQSWFSRISTFSERLTLVSVTLGTGRTHQIRVHARAIGFPVIGDRLYHHPTTLPKSFSEKLRNLIRTTNRQMLHAEELTIIHPGSGASCVWRAQKPIDFIDLIEHLSPYCDPGSHGTANRPAP